MIILHVIIDLKTGGAELMLKRLVDSHAHNPRYIHRVISLKSLGTVGPQLLARGTEVEALGLNSLLQVPKTVWRLIRRMREIQPDVVQTWMYHADLLGGLAARLVGIQTILWGVRISDINRAMGISTWTALVRRVCAILSGLVPTRIIYVAHSARITHEALGYESSKSVVIPNGYAVRQEPSALDRAFLRNELGLDMDHILIGSAGRYSAQKDHATFIAAAAKLAYNKPCTRFVMMGRGVDAGNRDLTNLISAAGLEHKVFLLGERSDLIECLAGLDIFCLHSIGEGFPNVVAEAMSVQIPCVVTDVGDAAFLVGNTGTVVPAGEVQAIAVALEEMVTAGPEARAQLGKTAGDRIVANFSVDAIRARYESVYHYAELA